MPARSGEDGSVLPATSQDRQFVFPQTGPLKPPDPPRPYTLANLELTHQQASTLWPDITKQSCANALESHFADGDPTKAIVLIQFYRDAVDGYVTSVCARNGTYLPLRGAMNVNGVSCYVDALLYAMFSRMENFEPLLYKRHYGDLATDRFATWLRLFVNLLRNGERITEDIVSALMATAVAAGWATSSPLSQQDAAEFFVFITEKLLMPLLVLRVDIAHAGKEAEEFDHKMIKEQLLYLPVPGTDEDPPILLEECFEIYFSNVINVSRHLSQPANNRHSHQLLPAISPSSSQLSTSGAVTASPQSISPFPTWGNDISRSPSPPLTAAQPEPASMAISINGSDNRPGVSSSTAWPQRSRSILESPYYDDANTPSQSSVSEMASTLANWLSTSSHDRTAGSAPTNRRRSYSILSLTSSPGFRKGSRAAAWDDAYSASPSPSLPLMATPDLERTIHKSSGLANVETTVFPHSVHRPPPPTPPSNQLIDPLDKSDILADNAEEPVGAMNDQDSSSGFALEKRASIFRKTSMKSNAPTAIPEHPGSPSLARRSVEPDSFDQQGDRTGSLPSYHQLFGFNDDRQAEARVRDMKQTLWTSNNEVMLPAWMFLQLMPFYADNIPNENEPITNLEADEVAHHFRRARPVLGICLKRYFVDENGTPQRNNRKLIIPETINMPSFVADDSDHKQAFGKFKLVLESAILHRGNSIHSGHYCALSAEPLIRQSSGTANPGNHPGNNNLSSAAGARKNTFQNVLSTPESKRLSSWSQNSLPPAPLQNPMPLQNSPPMSAQNITIPSSPSASGSSTVTTPIGSINDSLYTQKQPQQQQYGGRRPSTSAGRKWYLFDDVQSGGDRIKEVNHTEVFEKESPYMLFYRMVSLEEEENGDKLGPSTASSLRPPSSISVNVFDPSSRPTSRAPSPEPGKEKDKKKKSKFFRRHKDKDPQREKDKSTKDYASRYREEKCSVM